jgi:hypothetical protein
MKLHRLSILLIVLLAGLAFTSCEDEEWVRSRLDITTAPDDPVTNNSGNLSVTFNLYDTDIQGYDPRTDRLLNMDLYFSSLSLFSRDFRYNDRVDVTIETNTRTTIDLRLYVDGERYAYIDSNDPAFRNFMYDVMNQLVDRGNLSLTFYVNTGINQRIPIGIDLNNDLDLYIRY